MVQLEIVGYDRLTPAVEDSKIRPKKQCSEQLDVPVAKGLTRLIVNRNRMSLKVHGSCRTWS